MKKLLALVFVFVLLCGCAAASEQAKEIGLFEEWMRMCGYDDVPTPGSLDGDLVYKWGGMLIMMLFNGDTLVACCITATTATDADVLITAFAAIHSFVGDYDLMWPYMEYRSGGTGYGFPNGWYIVMKDDDQGRFCCNILRGK